MQHRIMGPEPEDLWLKGVAAFGPGALSQQHENDTGLLILCTDVPFCLRHQANPSETQFPHL